MRPLLLLLSFACSTSSDSADTGDSGAGYDTSDPDGDPDTIALAGGCDLGVRWGGFKVEANSDYSAIDGQIANGVVPVTVLEKAAEEGNCRLMKRNNPFCDPTCGPGYTCDFDGTCIEYPANQDLGTVTITGLKDAVAMEPLAPSTKYSFTKLQNPAFEAGKLIELKTAGGAYDPLTLHGVGMAVLQPVSLEWVVTEGTPLQLAWDAPAEAVRSEVFVSVNVDQHGITPITLECTFEDDGAGEIASSVMDALLAAGVSGYPTGKMLRRTVDKVEIGEGCADFTVDYATRADVTVTGHTPCSGPQDCPEGMECNLAIQTCE